MTRRPTKARTLIVGGVTGLMSVTTAGGALLAWAERTTYIEGLAHAFSTVSTTGFGPGPQTTPGTFLTFGIFAAGAACWFAIVVAAFETGLRRYRASVSGTPLEHGARDVWPPFIMPRGRG